MSDPLTKRLHEAVARSQFAASVPKLGKSGQYTLGRELDLEEFRQQDTPMLGFCNYF